VKEVNLFVFLKRPPEISFFLPKRLDRQLFS